MCAAPLSVYVGGGRRALSSRPNIICGRARCRGDRALRLSSVADAKGSERDREALRRASSSILSAFRFRVHLFFAGLPRIGCKISGCSLKIRSAESCKWLLRVQEVAARRAESTEFGLFSSYTTPGIL